MKNEGLRTARRAGARIAIATGLLLAACSSDESGAVSTTTTTTEAPTTTAAPTTTMLPSHFHGGCERFVIYGQNNQEPYGSAVRSEPNPGSEKIGSIDPNETVGVDGWVHGGTAPYPDNPKPFDSDIYFHVANLINGKEGWVSSPGTRGDVTVHDPTLLDGIPAPTTPECEGTYLP